MTLNQATVLYHKKHAELMARFAKLAQLIADRDDAIGIGGKPSSELLGAIADASLDLEESASVAMIPEPEPIPQPDPLFTDPPIDEPESRWFSEHVIVSSNVHFSGKLVSSLTDAQLSVIKTKWVDTFPEAIEKDEDKRKQRDAILAEIEWRKVRP